MTGPALPQPPTGTLPTALPAPAGQAYAQWLAGHRPDLADRFVAALPGARAAVLARLWGAIVREPLPGRGPGVARVAGTVTVGGLTLHGPAAAAEPFAAAPVGLSISGYVEPAALAARLWPAHPGFAAELDNSVANLALARAAYRTPDGDADGSGLVAAEQSIVDGHPLHPCCRTRCAMSVADVLAYAPEHRPTVDLVVVAVPPDRWLSTGRGLRPLLHMHPWQWERVRGTYPFLEPTGAVVPARPLMSLRTLATAGGHVKTAVDVQMTSAVRTVSAAAVHNGPVLSALLTRLTDRMARFGVLAEPAAGAVLVDGQPCRSLAVVHRAAPALRPGERALPLAALTGGRPSVADLVGGGDPVAFLADLAALLLGPLLALLDRGVALEAHGQNLVLVTAGGRPVRLLYRDFGGVRVDPDRLRRGGVDALPLRGDIPTDDPEVLRTKVFASVVAVVLAGLVHAVATRYGVAPDRLWAAVATALGPGAAARALTSTVDLPVKATTAMRLAGNADDIWARVGNPLAGAR